MVTELPDDPLFYGQVNKNWWASISEACDKNLISFYCSSLAFLSTDRRQKRLTYLKGKKRKKKKMSNITTWLYYITMLLFWDLKWVSCKLKDSHLGCKNFWSHCFVYCRLPLFFYFFTPKCLWSTHHLSEITLKNTIKREVLISVLDDSN